MSASALQNRLRAITLMQAQASQGQPPRPAGGAIGGLSKRQLAAIGLAIANEAAKPRKPSARPAGGAMSPAQLEAAWKATLMPKAKAKAKAPRDAAGGAIVGGRKPSMAEIIGRLEQMAMESKPRAMKAIHRGAAMVGGVRPLSAYQMFVKENAAAVRAELAAEGWSGRELNKETFRMIGQMWRSSM